MRDWRNSPSPGKVVGAALESLLGLADEVVATVTIGIYDRDQGVLLVGEARDLVERIQNTLVEIEMSDPTWPGCAAVEPPKGTMVGQLLQGGGSRSGLAIRNYASAFRERSSARRTGRSAASGRPPLAPTAR